MKLLALVLVAFGISAPAMAGPMECGPSKLYRSAVKLPNGSTFINEPGIYEEDTKVYSFAYTSDEMGLCALLGFESSKGSTMGAPEGDQVLSCINVDAESKFADGDCSMGFFKTITCK
jgi:hypothetical protein